MYIKYNQYKLPAFNNIIGFKKITKRKNNDERLLNCNLISIAKETKI